MGVLKGDFIGFQFGEYHSSELGIVRISDGSRYNEEIIPVPVDKTVQRPGSDGTYFFNSFYSQKPITIQFAFDSLTEAQLRKLRAVFATKAPQKLIYDETPYKYYLVKCGASPQMRYICFEVEGKRIYKGEGTLSLMAYYPYAKSTYKWLEDFESTTELKFYKDFSIKERKDHIAEWNHMSFDENAPEDIKPDSGAAAQFEGLIYKSGYSQLDVPQNKETGVSFNVYNPGDLETDFTLTIPFISTDNELCIGQKGEKLVFSIKDRPEYFLSFERIIQRGQDTHIIYNSASNLIEGYKENKGVLERTGNVYNNYRLQGDFFKLPLGWNQLIISGLNDNANVSPIINYNYLYY